jgi:hypothetical protein
VAQPPGIRVDHAHLPGLEPNADAATGSRTWSTTWTSRKWLPEPSQGGASWAPGAVLGAHNGIARTARPVIGAHAINDGRRLTPLRRREGDVFSRRRQSSR